MNNDDFFSFDRLVEFGIGVGVAQQMVKSMNYVVGNVTIPGVMNPMQTPPAIYYAVVDGQSTGPLQELELQRLIHEKKVTKDTYIWKPGMSDWQLAQTLPDVLKLVALAPPPFNP
jgi:hypothetical protein